MNGAITIEIPARRGKAAFVAAGKTVTAIILPINGVAGRPVEAHFTITRTQGAS